MINKYLSDVNIDLTDTEIVEIASKSKDQRETMNSLVMAIAWKVEENGDIGTM